MEIVCLCLTVTILAFVGDEEVRGERGMSILAPQWVRLSPNGTLGFQIIFSYILNKRVRKKYVPTQNV